MNWTNDSDKTEDQYVAEHTLHMGDSREVIHYLRVRHRKIMQQATGAEVHEAYQQIPEKLRKEWRVRTP